MYTIRVAHIIGLWFNFKCDLGLIFVFFSLINYNLYIYILMNIWLLSLY